jgi:hypothetical protein
MSTYSPYLRVTLIGTGEQAGTWGTTTNNNYQYGFESAIAGYYPKTVAAGNNFINVTDGTQFANAEYPNANYKLSGASAAYALYLPPYENKYTFWNTTASTATIACATVVNTTTSLTATALFSSAATSISLTTSTNLVVAVGMSISGSGITAGTIITGQTSGTTGGTGTYTISVATTGVSSSTYTFGIPIPAGASMTVFSDGYNVFESTNSVAGNLLVGGTATIGGALSGGAATFTKDSAVTSKGSLGIPVGATTDRVVSAAGSAGIRYNTTLSRFEGYDVNNTTWNTIGGGATGGGANQVFYENGQQITANYTVPSGKNAMTTGPVTIVSFSGTGSISGYTLTIASSPAPTGSLYIGAAITGTNVTGSPTITAFVGGATGGAGQYTLGTSQTAASGSITSDVVVTVSNGSYLVVI